MIIIIIVVFCICPAGRTLQHHHQHYHHRHHRRHHHHVASYLSLSKKDPFPIQVFFAAAFLRCGRHEVRPATVKEGSARTPGSARIRDQRSHPPRQTSPPPARMLGSASLPRFPHRRRVTSCRTPGRLHRRVPGCRRPHPRTPGSTSGAKSVNSWKKQHSV